MQRFLDPEGLRSRGLEHFDAWAATFGEVIDTMEISPDGNGLRPRSRFARFTNLPELQQMFRAFSDVQTAEMLNLPRPRLQGGKPIVVACPMSDEQYALQLELVERYDRLRSQKVDPRIDNALNITTDGRKLATDARMLSATAPDFAESKVNRLVDNVVGIWERTAPKRGTQMIFADMGVNPTEWGYSPYSDIIEELIAAGVPAEQIACIGDAESDAKKQALFEKVRQGSVRVLIGSTQKMGTGTNVQKRLVGLHHLDAPWKPAEVEQREGRILRQNNENEEVAIYRYVTEGSFDAYMWQALETKARFIGQVITGDNAARRAEDIGGQELSYAEVKAIASGIQVEWNSRFTRRLGDASYSLITMGAKIRLSSSPLWARASEKDRRETVVHETCHVVVKYKHGPFVADHGPEGKAAMRACGVEPLRTHSVDRTGLARRQRRFVILGCPNEGIEHKCRMTVRDFHRVQKGIEFWCKRRGIHITENSLIEEDRTAVAGRLAVPGR
jgi:predicted SprT family Zn-dependent metalloprotease